VATTGASFSAALEALEARTRAERADVRVNPDCISRVLHHGDRTRRAIVLLHGITSSPYQFAELGTLFHARGYTVLMPRMPLHGFVDRRTTAPQRLTTHDFIDYAGEAIEAAHTLADHVTLVGLSVSGTITAHCAQTRTDVDLAVLLAPAFAPWSLPIGAVRPISQLVKKLPNMNAWWDPIKRDSIGPACSYPRFSTHAMAEAFSLGADVYALAKHQAPHARAIVCVTNNQDLAVNNRATQAVLDAWLDHGANITRHAFTNEIARLHDFIGPYQPGARPDVVYPTLVKLIDRASA
jgi:esterase/lipase